MTRFKNLFLTFRHGTADSLVFALLLVLFLGCGAGPKSKAKDKIQDRAAVAGVGKKQGEGYGDAVPILKPASVMWNVKEKLVFGFITHFMNLYEATNGHMPKSHQQFMDKIIKANKVKLPKLDDGLEYFYDAEKEELMVRSVEKSERKTEK